MQLRREYIVRKRRDLNLRRVNFPGGDGIGKRFSNPEIGNIHGD